MKMTKFSHSCVRCEKDGRVLVLDPGSFSETDRALAGADAVLVTHEHPDHLDRGPVLAAMSASPDLVLHAPASLAGALRNEAPELAERIVDAVPDAEFELAGFTVRSFGGQHALIHPLVPMVANLGYLIEGSVYHPGDSFIVPYGLRARILLLPIHAPWSKVQEVLDFLIACGADTAYPIHDALLNGNGRAVVEKHLERIGAMYGTEYVALQPGDEVQV